MNEKELLEKIEDILPQTQCRRCLHKDCHDYALAVLKGESTNLCVPGAVEVAKALSGLLNKPYLPPKEEKSFPKLLARIQSQQCIGCTKCLDICPVNAILGAPKYLHFILEKECTGCELCIPICPVDCIETYEDKEPWTKVKAQEAKIKYQKKQIQIQKKHQKDTEHFEEKAQNKNELVNDFLKNLL